MESRDAQSPPLLWLLVGPNGAGKTTYYRRFVAPRLRAPFVNADLIAADRWPTAPGAHAYEAAKVAATLRDRLVRERRSFVAETVFSHPSKLNLIRDAREAGYVVWISFLYLETAELAISRVGTRVREAGHFVPADKIRGRYDRLINTIRAALPLADTLFMIDNSYEHAAFRTVAMYHQGHRSFLHPKSPAWMRHFA